MASKRKTKIEAGTEKRTETLAAQTKRNKEKLVEELEKCPIVQVACQRLGIGRATYYKWRTEDVAFMRAADTAIRRGVSFVNDLAESKVIKGIQDDNITFTIFWLKHRHVAYSEKMQHRHLHEIQTQEIDPEQIALIKRAMGNSIIKAEKDRKAGRGGKSWDPHDHNYSGERKRNP